MSPPPLKKIDPPVAGVLRRCKAAMMPDWRRACPVAPAPGVAANCALDGCVPVTITELPEIWPRKSISQDSGLPLGRPSATELTLGHNVGSKAEVDAVMEKAKNAGAIIVKPAQDTFWGGYAGYFQDPDQHLWEIVWNPQWAVGD